MLPSNKILLQQAAETIEASERRCDAAQESIRYADHHLATSREAIKRSDDRLSRLGGSATISRSANSAA